MDKSFGASGKDGKEESNSSGVSSSTDVEGRSRTDAATKRKTDTTEDGQPPAKKAAASIRVDGGFKWNLQALAKAADAVGSGGKSPVSALNELGLKVNYSTTRQGGPAHCPNFSVSVTVANMTFDGFGHSKRDARASAARACLSSLLERAGRVLPTPGPPPDFTSDEPAKSPVPNYQLEMNKVVVRPPEIITKLAPTPNMFGPLVVVPAPKSPINTLYELYPGLIFNCTYGDGSPLDCMQAAPPQLSHSMRFKVVCQIKDQLYEGYGSSKKLAKLAAARAALGELYERTPAHVTQHPGAESLPQAMADHVAKLVNEKFNELMRGDLVHSKRKVLAGIVLTIEDNVDTAKVIAVATGTKCVSGEHISVRGQAVNDGHAEVVARRCLQRFLYSQLLMYALAKDPTKMIPESELEPIPGGGYQMKEDRRLHLYVSTAPCGDGRIFSPHENYSPEPDRHPNRLARGQLRTKIESGEGTIPVKNSTNVVQTWDGLLQGERLLTMSCSDKMARWCVVGLQGALLGRLLRPVYLHSLVLGSLLHHHHMYRALCGRVEAHLCSLPPPYRLQRPRLARAASTEARTPARAPSFSVCWATTSPSPEVISSTTGKLESGHPSMVCKQSMFARWHYLVTRLPLLDQPESARLPSAAELEHLPYNEAKLLCSPYQEAKDSLINAFDSAQLGRWIKKPMEQDQFACEILRADPALLFAWAGGAHRGNAMQIAHNECTEIDDVVQNNDDSCDQIHVFATKIDKLPNVVLKTDLNSDMIAKNDNLSDEIDVLATKIDKLLNAAIKTNLNSDKIAKNDNLSDEIDVLATENDKLPNVVLKTNLNSDEIAKNDNLSDKIDVFATKIDKLPNVVLKSNLNSDKIAKNDNLSDKIDDFLFKNDKLSDAAFKTNLNDGKIDNVAPKNYNRSDKIDGFATKTDKLSDAAFKTNLSENDGVAPKNDNLSDKIDGFATKNDKLPNEALKTNLNECKIDAFVTKNDKLSTLACKTNLKYSKIEFVASKNNDLFTLKTIGRCTEMDDVFSENDSVPSPVFNTNTNRSDKRDDVATKNDGIPTVALKSTGHSIKIDEVAIQNDSCPKTRWVPNKNRQLNMKTRALRRPKCVSENDYANFDCNYETSVPYNNSRSNRINSNSSYIRHSDGNSKFLPKTDTYMTKNNIREEKTGTREILFHSNQPQVVSDVKCSQKIADKALESYVKGLGLNIQNRNRVTNENVNWESRNRIDRNTNRETSATAGVVGNSLLERRLAAYRNSERFMLPQ